MKNKYAIDANWWRQWCDFVNIEFQTQSKLVELLYSDISHKVKDDINAPKGDVDPAGNYILTTSHRFCNQPT